MVVIGCITVSRTDIPGDYNTCCNRNQRKNEAGHLIPPLSVKTFKASEKDLHVSEVQKAKRTGSKPVTKQLGRVAPGTGNTLINEQCIGITFFFKSNTTGVFVEAAGEDTMTIHMTHMVIQRRLQHFILLIRTVDKLSHFFALLAVSYIRQDQASFWYAAIILLTIGG